MKKLMMALVLAVTTAGAFAQNTKGQDAKTPEERTKARTERMKQELGLSTDQAMRVEALNRKYAEEAGVMRTQQYNDRAARHAAFKERRVAYDTDLKTVLTADQYTKWIAMKEEMKAKHRAKHKEMRADKREQQKVTPVPVEPEQ